MLIQTSQKKEAQGRLYSWLKLWPCCVKTFFSHIQSQGICSKAIPSTTVVINHVSIWAEWKPAASVTLLWPSPNLNIASDFICPGASQINSLLTPQDTRRKSKPDICHISICSSKTWSDAKLFDIIEETGRTCSWIGGEEVMDSQKKICPPTVWSSGTARYYGSTVGELLFLFVSFRYVSVIRCILSLSLSVQERVRLSWLPFVNDREEHSQWYCCVCVSVGRHFFSIRQPEQFGSWLC